MGEVEAFALWCCLCQVCSFCTLGHLKSHCPAFHLVAALAHANAVQFLKKLTYSVAILLSLVTSSNGG